MKVLTPAALTPHGGSLRLLCLVFRTSNPQPRYGPEHRFRSRLNALGGSCDPGFAMNEQARRTMPPKRVRHPAGCSFASSCSPPRIAATQLPSATCATTSHRTDFHPPDKTASQTHSFPRKRESRARHARPSLDARCRGHDTDVSESSRHFERLTRLAVDEECVNNVDTFWAVAPARAPLARAFTSARADATRSTSPPSRAIPRC